MFAFALYMFGNHSLVIDLRIMKALDPDLPAQPLSLTEIGAKLSFSRAYGQSPSVQCGISQVGKRAKNQIWKTNELDRLARSAAYDG